MPWGMGSSQRSESTLLFFSIPPIPLLDSTAGKGIWGSR